MLDFLGIGAQKAGTTWLFKNLIQHPEISFPAGKEIHFFDQQYDKGLEWYKGLFEIDDGKHHGEITPAYSFLDTNHIKELHDLNPGLRIFFSVRNPIDRAWSSAMMALRRAEMTLEEASDQWFIDHFNSQGSRLRGDYIRTLEHWLSVFDEAQLLLIDFAMIQTDPEAILKQCCQHIRVDDGFFALDKGTIITEKVYEGSSHTIRESLLPILHTLYDDQITQMKTHPLLKSVSSISNAPVL